MLASTGVKFARTYQWIMNMARGFANNARNQKMTDDEIRTEIYYEVERLHIEKYEEMDSIYRQLKEEANDFYYNKNRITERLDEIEAMIKAHSIGVQNVYKEVQSLKEIYGIAKT
jgi:hypothetical protein